MSIFRLSLCALMALAMPVLPAQAWFGKSATLRQSVVKIHVNMQHEDYLQPWQARGIGGGNGTGFIISRKRILTNAHVVSDTRFLEIEREGDPRRYAAEVAFIGHDCDLAVLRVKDESFFNKTTPLKFHTRLPTLNDEVIAVGYPVGGSRISLTRGVVSRIDHNSYAHSAVDAHLVMQVDAAINPGNSGGPVLFENKVVGLAFQGLVDSQSIGYAIPLPVINHFLEDIEDGIYNGYPELGVGYLETRNPALRKELNLDSDRSGVVVSYLDPYGSATGHLHHGDVLLNIDGYNVGDDGTIRLDGNTVEFTELMERKQWGEKIMCAVWRNSMVTNLVIALTNPTDPFSYRHIYDQRPEYFIIQGLVFSPLTRNYLSTMGADLNNATAQNLVYNSQFVKIDDLYTNRTQFVVLINRLPHPANTYSQEYVTRVVQEVNGRVIGSLADLRDAVAFPRGGFHVIRFEGSDNPLILDTAFTAPVNSDIMDQYKLPALMQFNPPLQ